MESKSSKTKSCCPPRTNPRTNVPSLITKSTDTTFELCEVPGGTALIGTDYNVMPLDEESPARYREIKSFRMMQTAVTNAMFREFIDDTGYKTDAQRFGWSFVFHQLLANHRKGIQSTVGSEWWRKADGAYPAQDSTTQTINR